MPYCEQCGSKVSPETSFCPRCGTRLGTRLRIKRYRLPGGRRKWYAFVALAVLLESLFVSMGQQDLVTSVLTMLLFFGLFALIPAFLWYVLAKTLIGPRYFHLFFPQTMSFTKRLFKLGRGKSVSKVQYFLHKPERVRVGRRTVRVFLAALGLTAICLPYISNGYVGYLQTASSTASISSYFVVDIMLRLMLIFIVVMSFLPFILFPVWAYENMGLRHFDPDLALVGVPGEELRQSVTVLGAFFSLVGLLPLFYGDPNFLADALVVVTGAMITAFPPALAATVLFCFNIEPSLVAKFENHITVERIDGGAVSVSPSVKP